MINTEVADGIIERFEAEDFSLIVIESGKWTSDMKYEFKTTVVQDKESGKFYEIEESRTGSYYSDYEYSESSVIEVEPHTETKVITVWKEVK